MSRFSSMADAIASNEMGFCSVSACYNRRKGVSKYCHTHRSRHALYGHPKQSKTHSSRYAYERQLVEEVFDANSNHPGILSAVQWVQQWLDSAVATNDSEPVLAATDLLRLQTYGVTAQDIVIESAAFYIHSQWNKRAFLNDDAVDIAASLAVLQLAPLGSKTSYGRNGTQTLVPRRIRAAPRKKVGRWIRSHLLPLFINLQHTIGANRNVALTTRDAMRSPLTYPTKLIQTTNDQSSQ